MTHSHKIYNFLETGAQDYFYGISLLRGVCRNQALINTLSRKESEYHKEKLIYELSKHAKTPQNEHTERINDKPGEYEKRSLQRRTSSSSQSNENHQSSSQTSINENVGAILPDNSHVDRGHIDESLRIRIEELRVKRNELYGQRDHFHPMISSSKTDEERYDIAQKILSIQPKVDRINSQIDQIKKTGIVPTEVVKDKMSVETYKRVKLVESYIYRYNKELESDPPPAPSRKKKLESFIEKYTEELKQLKNGSN